MLWDDLKRFLVQKTFVYGYGVRKNRQFLSKIPPKLIIVHARQQMLESWTRSLEFWIRGTFYRSFCNRGHAIVLATVELSNSNLYNSNSWIIPSFFMGPLTIIYLLHNFHNSNYWIILFFLWSLQFRIRQVWLYLQNINLPIQSNTNSGIYTYILCIMG